METVWLHLALAGSGIAAGFINIVAGGGSLLTVPVLMLLGLPADLANGTNRLAVVSQGISGVIGFRRHGKIDTRAILPTVVPTTVGAALGALLASRVPADLLKYLLLGIMMAMAVVMLVRPAILSPAQQRTELSRARRVAGAVGLFAVGLYGGFVQAGVGLLLLFVLSGVLARDLVRAKALKVVCVAVFGSAALAVYAGAGLVVWLEGGLLAGYTIIGTLIGVRFAVRAEHSMIRWIVFACIVATCIAALIKG